MLSKTNRAILFCQEASGENQKHFVSNSLAYHLLAVPELSKMPVSSTNLEKVIETIADKEQLKVTVNDSGSGGIIAGVATAIRRVFPGPVGLAIGGAIGAYATSEEVKPVSEVLRTLDDQQKKKLHLAVNDTIDRSTWYDDTHLLRHLYMEGDWRRQRIIRVIIDFLQEELKMTVME